MDNDKTYLNVYNREVNVVLVTQPVSGASTSLINRTFVSDCDCADCACTAVSHTSAGEQLSQPLIYALELTPLCNSRCAGCFNAFIPWMNGAVRQGPDRLTFLDSAGWKRVLDVIAPHATHLKLTGGEPTLHPQFHTILDDIARRGISFTLFTNGRWRDPQTLVKLLTQSASSMPASSGLLISLHGVDAESHEAFSGIAGSFAETLANIRLATAAGLTVALSTVITRHNYTHIQDMIALGQALGVDHVVFNRYLGLPLPAIEPTAEQLAQAVLTVSELQQQGQPVRFGNCIPQCFIPGNTSTGCSAGIAYCAIDPLGNLRPCAHDGLICGNVLEHPLEEIWHGAAMQAWRNSVPEACQSCAALSQCRAGCLATARARGGQDPLMHIPLAAAPVVAPMRLRLYEKAIPVKRFTVYQEPWGLVAARGSQYVVAHSEVASVLAVCDGTTTLRQVSALLGKAALDFVGVLYQHGLVDLMW